jgi:hypothetical protein
MCNGSKLLAILSGKIKGEDDSAVIVEKINLPDLNHWFFLFLGTIVALANLSLTPPSCKMSLQ